MSATRPGPDARSPATAPASAPVVADVESGVARLSEIGKRLGSGQLSPDEQQALSAERLRAMIVLDAVALWTQDGALLRRVNSSAQADSPNTLVEQLQAHSATPGAPKPSAEVQELMAAASVMAALQGKGSVAWAEWRKASQTKGTVGAAVRLATAGRLRQVLQVLEKSLPESSLQPVATLMGNIICRDCAAVPQTKPQKTELFALRPGSLLCEAAARETKNRDAFVFASLVTRACKPKDYGLSSADEMALLVPPNAFYARLLASLRPASAESDPSSKVDPVLRSALQQARQYLSSEAKGVKLPLFVPWSGVGVSLLFEEPEKTADQPTAVALESNVQIRRHPIPLENVVVGTAEVRLTRRPLAQLDEEGVKFYEKNAPYAYPGKVAADIEGIKQADKQRAKQPKPRVKDRDVIVGFSEQVATFEQVLHPMEERVFAAVDPRLANFNKTERDKSVTIGVDAFAPAWLFRRTLASLRHVGYDHILLLKGDQAAVSLLPVVFRSEKGLPDSVAFRSHKRPMIAQVTRRYVHVFPPADPIRRPKALPQGPIRWPKGVARTMEPETKSLFKVTLKYEQDLREKLGQVVGKLRRINRSGNVVYVVAASNVASAKVLAVADAIWAAPGPAIEELEPLAPGLQCSEGTCPTHIPVLFGRVPMPRQQFFKKKEKPPPPQAPAGFCNKKKIAKTVRRRAGAFRYCYERELQQSPNIEGKVVVQWKVDETGRVKETKVVSSAIGVRRFQACLLDKIGRLRFPKPEGGVCVIRWPFVFTR